MSAPIRRKSKKRPSNGGAANKLISIRIPEETIKTLRRQASEKGNGMGYQQLIKSYISSGLSGEPAASPAQPSEIFREEMAAIATPVLPKHKKDLPAKVPSVMREDIKRLGEIFRPHLKHFAGKTFLITGAFGFLGRYLVLEWLEKMGLVDGRLICLVRAKSDEDARARLDQTFDTGNPALLTHYRELAADHLEVVEILLRFLELEVG